MVGGRLVQLDRPEARGAALLPDLHFSDDDTGLLAPSVKASGYGD